MILFPTNYTNEHEYTFLSHADYAKNAEALAIACIKICVISAIC